MCNITGYVNEISIELFCNGGLTAIKNYIRQYITFLQFRNEVNDTHISFEFSLACSMRLLQHFFNFALGRVIGCMYFVLLFVARTFFKFPNIFSASVLSFYYIKYFRCLPRQIGHAK